jgi:hypothetical protein
MRKLILLLSLCVAAARAQGQDPSPSPAAQFQALLKESQGASSSGRPLTDEERLKFVGEAYRRRFALATKFLALAEKYPNESIALDALMQAVWQVNGTPWPVALVGEDAARGQAFELIQRNHIGSDKLGPLCQRVSYGFAKEYEAFLRAVLTKNQNKEVQAVACLSLARFLNNRAERIALCKEQPELAKEFAGLFGQAYLTELEQQDPEKTAKEIEAVYERAAADYAGVALTGGETIAARAKAELFALRHLSVGKEPPQIEGEDQDGQRFKLTDYRGKVVLLDFWSYV